MIRFARDEDVDSIYSIMKQSIPGNWTIYSISNYIDSTILYLDTNGVVCGYLIFLNAADESDILSVAVIPDKRRTGIATKLISYYFDFCAEHNINSVFLEVRSKNQKAIMLYEKIGFLQISKRNDYYDNPRDDALIMKYLINVK